MTRGFDFEKYRLLYDNLSLTQFFGKIDNTIFVSFFSLKDCAQAEAASFRGVFCGSPTYLCFFDGKNLQFRIWYHTNPKNCVNKPLSGAIPILNSRISARTLEAGSVR